MNDDKPKSKRYLVEIRGVLHVSAPDGDTAEAAALAWLKSVSAEAVQKENGGGDTTLASDRDAPTGDARETVVRVGWLRPFPD